MIGGFLVGVLVGLVVGLALAAVLYLPRLGRVRAGAEASGARLSDAQDHLGRVTEQLQEARQSVAGAQVERARMAADLDNLRTAVDQRDAQLEQDRAQLKGAFAELSGRALQANNEQFLALAETRLTRAQQAARNDLAERQQAISNLMTPLEETLKRYESGLADLERHRTDAYSGLAKQLEGLTSSQEQLRKETANLVNALRSPQTRGRWGELQLRRVVELAGMLPHCDFDEQVSVDGDVGRLRPDMVVRLPGGGVIVVDAKVPLDAFLKANDAEDVADRKAQLVAHGRQVRAHVDQLAKKEYWRQFEGSAQQVVAFIPGDPLLAAAFEHDPSLQEHAMANGVLLTTPTALIALLRTIAFGWRQEALAQNAREVQQMGIELYNRLGTMGGHLAKLQRSLNATVEAFNNTVGSLESRVLVTARRFTELGVVGTEEEPLPGIRPVTTVPRSTQAAELEGPDAEVVMLPSPSGATAVWSSGNEAVEHEAAEHEAVEEPPRR